MKIMHTYTQFPCKIKDTRLSSIFQFHLAGQSECLFRLEHYLKRNNLKITHFSFGMTTQLNSKQPAKLERLQENLVSLASSTSVKKKTNQYLDQGCPSTKVLCVCVCDKIQYVVQYVIHQSSSSESNRLLDDLLEHYQKREREKTPY